MCMCVCICVSFCFCMNVSYLTSFRTEQCKDFLIRRCEQRRPYTCFYWHFPNQRRRKPIIKRDGCFNYSPEEYCPQYNESTGFCPNGDRYAVYIVLNHIDYTLQTSHPAVVTIRTVLRYYRVFCTSYRGFPMVTQVYRSPH